MDLFCNMEGITLSEFVGNTAVKGRIAALLEAGRLPHAIVLEGLRGIGRFTLAVAIAQALVCENGNACGKCLNCKQALRLTNPDVLVYEPDKKTVFSVDQVRKINSDAMIKPNQAARKVMILCNCEQMNDEAQNAFLKTLEEPPGRVQFILITTNSKMLLDTIRSRCAIFTLMPPDFDDGLRYLRSRGYQDESAEQALISAEGNIGRALELLGSGESPLDFGAREILSLAEKNKTIEILKKFSSIEKDRKKIALLLEQLAQLTTKLIRSKALNEGLEYNFSMKGLLGLQAAITEAESTLLQNGNKALLLTVLCERIICAVQM